MYKIVGRNNFRTCKHTWGNRKRYFFEWKWNEIFYTKSNNSNISSKRSSNYVCSFQANFIACKKRNTQDLTIFPIFNFLNFNLFEIKTKMNLLILKISKFWFFYWQNCFHCRTNKDFFWMFLKIMTFYRIFAFLTKNDNSKNDDSENWQNSEGDHDEQS